MNLTFRRHGDNAARRTLTGMNLKSVVVLLTVVAAGLFGGAAAYQVASSVRGSAEADARESVVVQEGGQGQGRARFAPCRKPAKLEAGRCVTDVVRTVTVPGSSGGGTAPARASGGAAPAFSGGDDDSHHGDDDDHGHHGGDDDGHHHSGEGEAGHHGDDSDDRDDDRDDDDDDDHSGHGGDDDDDRDDDDDDDDD